jgi:hypothetical protein
MLPVSQPLSGTANAWRKREWNPALGSKCESYANALAETIHPWVVHSNSGE